MEDIEKYYTSALQSYFPNIKVLNVKNSENQKISEHASSSLELVTIEYQIPNSELNTLDLVHKDNSTKIEDGYIIYSEGFFLMSFVKEMTNYSNLRKNDIETFDFQEIFPRTYYANEGIILMENLCTRGFNTKPIDQPHNIEESKVVLDTLAKFHANSYAMIIEAGGPKEFLEKFPQFKEKMHIETSEDTSSRWSIFKIILKILRKSEKYIDVLKKLEKYEDNIQSVYMDLVKFHESNFLVVLNHGDLWANNVLFNENHSKVSFIDLEATRVASPSTDLSYYIMTSTDHSVKENFYQLLKFYYEKFNSHVKNSVRFTFDELISDFRQKSKFGFFYGLIPCLGMDIVKKMFESIAEKQDTDDVIHKLLEQNPKTLELICENVASLVQIFNEFGEL